MQIIKKLFCSHFSVNKGLIQHVVQSCYNYNITFQKLEIHTVKMRPISACYTSGRGARHFLGIGRCTIWRCRRSHCATTATLYGVPTARMSERRATARTLSMLKVRAVAWRPRSPHGVQRRCYGVAFAL